MFAVDALHIVDMPAHDLPELSYFHAVEHEVPELDTLLGHEPVGRALPPEQAPVEQDGPQPVDDDQFHAGFGIEDDAEELLVLHRIGVRDAVPFVRTEPAAPERLPDE